MTDNSSLCEGQAAEGAKDGSREEGWLYESPRHATEREGSRHQSREGSVEDGELPRVPVQFSLTTSRPIMQPSVDKSGTPQDTQPTASNSAMPQNAQTSARVASTAQNAQDRPSKASMPQGEQPSPSKAGMPQFAQASAGKASTQQITARSASKATMSQTVQPGEADARRNALPASDKAKAAPAPAAVPGKHDQTCTRNVCRLIIIFSASRVGRV